MIELKDRLYTSTEVAEILGVSLRSVYRYLEEDKLKAEVKTATGRHRFTKANILDFLYPEGIDQKSDPAVVSPTPIKVEDKQPATQQITPPPVQPVQPTTEEPKVEPETVEPTPEAAAEKPPETPATEDPVDWLAKFREAAAKFKEEEDVKVSPEPAFVQEQAQATTPAQTVTGIGTETPQPVPASHPIEPKVEEQVSSVFYYRSALGGLKDIAQNIDKNARSSNVPYAFTLNAGLSLYKPIQPFSLLHVYTRSSDKEYYEKMLQLTPSDEVGAQLAIIISDDPSLYSQKDEVHGLYVVSKSQMAQDIKDFEMADLAKETADIIG